MTGRRSRLTTVLLAATAGTLAVAGSACSSSSSGSGGGTQAAATAPAASSGTQGVKEVPPPGGYITNFVKYVNGKPGAADPSLPPVKIGWASNDGGGTIDSYAPQATTAAEVTVDWINKYAGGIDGHPLELDKCPILNAEEEGQACAEKFLADPGISLISLGALSVGASTLESVVGGRKPIVLGSSLNASDVSAKNLWSLYSAFAFGAYPYGTFAVSPTFHAKNVAIVYRDAPGASSELNAATVSAEAGGAKVKAVQVASDATDLLGAYTAAGAATADITVALVSSPAQCLASANALHQLGVDPTKVMWRPSCDQPQIKSQLPGGDYPQYYSTEIQSGDNLIQDPTGQAFVAALAKFGSAAHSTDGWYSLIFGQVMTIAKFLNNIGYGKITPQAVIDQIHAWHGPQLMGGTSIQCNEFTIAPGNCSTGAYLFRYLGNGKWIRVSQWTEPPSALLTYLEKLPANGAFPTSWPPS